MDLYCQKYFDFGEYLGSCGNSHVGSLYILFRSWKGFTKKQKHARNVASWQQLQDRGVIEAFTFFSVMVPRAVQEDVVIEEVATPHEDEDTEEFDPQYEWPDTDDGF